MNLADLFDMACPTQHVTGAITNIDTVNLADLFDMACPTQHVTGAITNGVIH